MKRKPIIHFKFSITTRLEEGKGATRFLMFAVENSFIIIDHLKKKKQRPSNYITYICSASLGGYLTLIL